ncbi:MAG: hypothetical protein II255_01745, partial [Ruminiclostridium sp.]|nr:hypothetical protein [Ruminiclostridium sp.]
QGYYEQAVAALEFSADEGLSFYRDIMLEHMLSHIPTVQARFLISPDIARLEEANTPSLDRTADTFARILQGAATQLDPPWRASAVGQILYHVGRWIYLVDAWDDLPQDKLSGSYNPILVRFGDEAQEQKDYIRNTLHDSLGVADTAFSLLDWGEWEPLLGHILGTGLHAVEEAVFTGQWKKKQK